MNEEIKKRIGEKATLGLKRPNGVFFVSGLIQGVSDTHIFFRTYDGKEEAYLLADITKMEFEPGAPPKAEKTSAVV